MVASGLSLNKKRRSFNGTALQHRAAAYCGKCEHDLNLPDAQPNWPQQNACISFSLDIIWEIPVQAQRRLANGFADLKRGQLVQVVDGR